MGLTIHGYPSLCLARKLTQPRTLNQEGPKGLEKSAFVAQLSPTLCDPMDCPPGSSIHGILQARIWSGSPCPAPGDLPNPGIELQSPTLQADPLPSEPPGKPLEEVDVGWSSALTMARLHLPVKAAV